MKAKIERLKDRFIADPKPVEIEEILSPMTNKQAADVLRGMIDYDREFSADEEAAVALAVSVLTGGHGERRSGEKRRNRDGEFSHREIKTSLDLRRRGMSLHKGRRKEDHD